MRQKKKKIPAQITVPNNNANWQSAPRVGNSLPIHRKRYERADTQGGCSHVKGRRCSYGMPRAGSRQVLRLDGLPCPGGSNAGPGKPGWGVSYVHFHSISHFPMNVSLTLARTHLNVYRRPRLRNHKLPGPATMFLYHHGPRVSVSVETNTCVDLSDVSG